MIFHTIMNHLKMTVAGVGILMLTSCNGIFDDIYDQPKEIVPAKGQLLIRCYQLDRLVLCGPEPAAATHRGGG